MTRQLRLPVQRDRTTIAAKRDAADEANIRCARIILERPEYYAGLQVEWARAVVEKQKQTEGRLF